MGIAPLPGARSGRIAPDQGTEAARGRSGGRERAGTCGADRRAASGALEVGDPAAVAATAHRARIALRLFDRVARLLAIREFYGADRFDLSVAHQRGRP